MAASGQPALGEACMGASRRAAASAPAGEAPGSVAAATAMSPAVSARGDEIHQIVAARRRPAEGKVALGFMADHAVGGVDGLVGERAGQPDRRASHRAGATIPSEKFSARLSIAARATPASSSAFTSRPTIFATASRRRASETRSAAATVGDMVVKAALRDEAGCDERERNAAGRDSASSDALTSAPAPSDEPRATAAAPRRLSPGAARSRRVVAVEPRVERGNQRADPGDGMADAREERSRDSRARRIDRERERGADAETTSARAGSREASSCAISPNAP